METPKPFDRGYADLLPLAYENRDDYRARIVAHQAEIVERRQQEIQEQSSTAKTPAARIELWERLHQIALPRDPGHRVLQVVANQTGLSLEDVLEEQRQRRVRQVGGTA